MSPRIAKLGLLLLVVGLGFVLKDLMSQSAGWICISSGKYPSIFPGVSSGGSRISRVGRGRGGGRQFVAPTPGGGANLLLPAATKLGQGNVFTGVCDSVNGGDVYLRYTIPPGQTPSLGRHPPGLSTPPPPRTKCTTPPRTKCTPPKFIFIFILFIYLFI